MSNRIPLGKKIRFEVFKRDNFTCQYCGAKSPNVELHVDHFVPVAMGGPNDSWNLVTACRDCNYGKRDQTIRKIMVKDWMYTVTGMSFTCDGLFVRVLIEDTPLKSDGSLEYFFKRYGADGVRRSLGQTNGQILSLGRSYEVAQKMGPESAFKIWSESFEIGCYSNAHEFIGELVSYICSTKDNGDFLSGKDIGIGLFDYLSPGPQATFYWGE